MGKKVNWFSAIKKAFSPNSKQKLANDHETEKKNPKKWGLGKKHGGGTSFIPLYRKPSSIEKILGDAEKEQQIRHPPASSGDQRLSIPSRVYQQQPEVNHNTTNNAKNQQTASSNERQKEPPLQSRVYHQQSEVNHNTTNTAKNQQTASSNECRREQPSLPSRVYHQQSEVKYNTANSTRNQRTAAIKIQTAYRGYKARKNIRALKGMMRLQGVVRGHNVKRQTLNAMKQMQLLVKVQSQIQLRRINMLENLQHQNPHKNDRELENSLGRWNLTQPSETDQNEEWDDSVLTIEEIEARTQRKAEALMKRERILAYANSKQWFKAGSTQMSETELRSGALPWWWIRIEQQLPKHSHEPLKNKSIQTSRTPERSPRPQSKQSRFGAENLNSPRPTSYKLPTTTKSPRAQHSPILSNRLPQSNSSTPMKHAIPRNNGNAFSFSLPLRDDDSFTSCPPLSVPNYMTPTLSAKAKLRSYGNLNEGPVTPTPGQKRRSSFPLTQSFGSIGWKRASSLFSNSNKDVSRSQTVQGNHRAMSVQSIGNLSVDSTTSMPAAVGRKPFNRFV